VSLNADNKYYGFYITDTYDVNSLLSVTASSRYNIAKIDLADQLGANLNGNNRFTHLNPAIGATYKLLPNVTVFLSLATNNRAPTASEIECSNPEQPCLLPSSLASDPPKLKQVVRKPPNWVSGGIGNGIERRSTQLECQLVPDQLGRRHLRHFDFDQHRFFQNIGSTRRQGFETGLTYQERNVGVCAIQLHRRHLPLALLLHSPSNPVPGR